MSSFRRIVRAALVLAALAGGAWPLSAAAVGFRTRALPLAAFGSPYRAELLTVFDGRCIDGGAGFAVVDGELPAGLELRGNTITGVPQEFGAFAVRLRVSNDCGAEERDFVVEVTGRPILHVAPEQIELEYQVGGTVTAGAVLQVSATWPAYRYSVIQGGEKWLRVLQNTGMTPRPGSPFAADVVELQIVVEGLAPGKYESVLVFAGPQGATPVSVPVRLRVVAAN